MLVDISVIRHMELGHIDCSLEHVVNVNRLTGGNMCYACSQID